MSIIAQINDFLFFILLGIIISCIFDIFRTLRRIQKTNSIYVVMIQDIIFFVIITIISVIYITTILTKDLRLYMLIAIIIGIIISRRIRSKPLIKFYSAIFETIKYILEFIFYPMQLYFTFIYKLIKKIKEKCCKLFSHMINLKCNLLSVFKKNKIFKKRGLKNERKFKNKRKGKKEKKDNN